MHEPSPGAHAPAPDLQPRHRALDEHDDAFLDMPMIPLAAPMIPSFLGLDLPGSVSQAAPPPPPLPQRRAPAHTRFGQFSDAPAFAPRLRAPEPPTAPPFANAGPAQHQLADAGAEPVEVDPDLDLHLDTAHGFDEVDHQLASFAFASGLEVLVDAPRPMSDLFDDLPIHPFDPGDATLHAAAAVSALGSAPAPRRARLARFSHTHAFMLYAVLAACLIVALASAMRDRTAAPLAALPAAAPQPLTSAGARELLRPPVAAPRAGIPARKARAARRR